MRLARLGAALGLPGLVLAGLLAGSLLGSKGPAQPGHDARQFTHP